MNSRLLFIQALSPVHCGTGRAIGGIDLPIAREVPTNLPIVPGSTLKGVLRAMDLTDAKLHTAVFGPDTINASDHAGCVQFSDATLLFLPVRSLYGTFAWVTSPFMVRRFLRDAHEAGIEVKSGMKEPDSGRAFVVGDRLKSEDGKVVFEDLDFDTEPNDPFKGFIEDIVPLLFPGENTQDERRLFLERACLINDDVMGLLLQTSMVITARIRINPDSGTVDKGALWTEEALPVESVLFGLVVATPVRLGNGKAPGPEELFSHVGGLIESTVQFGGNATVGRGLCRVVMSGEAGDGNS